MAFCRWASTSSRSRPEWSPARRQPVKRGRKYSYQGIKLKELRRHLKRELKTYYRTLKQEVKKIGRIEEDD